MNSALRFIFLVYFVTHIPITLCVDMQALLPHMYPQLLKDLMSWYISTYRDPLMIMTPIWFKSFIAAEAVFQLPFFFVAVHGLYHKLNWIRIPGIIYGAHVSTTLVPILAEICFGQALDESVRRQLVLFYLPYLVIPLMFMLTLALNKHPFGRNLKSD